MRALRLVTSEPVRDDWGRKYHACACKEGFVDRRRDGFEKCAHGRGQGGDGVLHEGGYVGAFGVNDFCQCQSCDASDCVAGVADDASMRI